MAERGDDRCGRDRHGGGRRGLIAWRAAAARHGARRAACRGCQDARRAEARRGAITAAFLAKCAGATVACGAWSTSGTSDAVCTSPAFTVMVFTLIGLIGSPEPGCGAFACAGAACGGERVADGRRRGLDLGGGRDGDRSHRVGTRKGRLRAHAAAAAIGSGPELRRAPRPRQRLPSSRRSWRRCGWSRRWRYAARSARACAHRARRPTRRRARRRRCGGCRAAPTRRG